MDNQHPAGLIPGHITTAGPSTGIVPAVLPPELVMEAAAFEAARAEAVGTTLVGRTLARTLGRADTFLKAVATEVERGGVATADREAARKLAHDAAD